MEYCAGGDLFAYLDRRGFKLNEPRAAQLIHKLSTAIFYLHSYGIAHRDIKPENILTTNDTDEADIKLVDFGLSKIIGPNETCNEPFGTLVIF
jgi:serine/threonine protein kinase